jgi:hypothetical protein
MPRRRLAEAASAAGDQDAEPFDVAQLGLSFCQ